MKSIEQLVFAFADETVQRDKAMWDGRSREIGKHSRRMVAAFQDLVRWYGDEGREALSVHLTDPRPNVRTTTAAFLLRYKTKESLAVLEELAKSGEGTAWIASEAIKRWEEGNNRLDPIDIEEE